MREHPSFAPAYADIRREARSLYWRGWGVTDIFDEFVERGVKVDGKAVARSTIESWKQRGKWEEAPPIRAAEESVLVRYQMLVAKDKKTGADFKEIDLLGRQIERLERCRKYRQSGNEADLNPNVEARNAKPKKAKRPNLITAEMATQLREAFERECFAYQLVWWENADRRTRFILKSRQIGATWYFAREALIDALETGRNQIFLSASRRQAEIFRKYIVEFVFRVTGLQLKGEHILIDRGDDADGKPLERPELFFLGANYRTAQGEHGNFYYDECFWAQGFDELDDVASGMASQKRYRETYFSTPSSVAHAAYRKWTGEKFNDGRAKSDFVKIDLDDKALKAGSLGGDGIWRHKVTIVDAAEGGCDLFDIEELRRRKAPDVFDNLYMCGFVDDSASAFPFAMMQRCQVDALEAWPDFQPFGLRPYAGDVAIGYDPQESADGDDAALVVVALPTKPKAPFRVLEKLRLRGGFETQAEAIFKAMRKYRVVDIGIDTTGVGAAVFQLVKKRFPMVRGLKYSAELKAMMVFKAKAVIAGGRLQFDDDAAPDIIASFVSIRPHVTASQRMVTYVASRSGDTGHADVAWSIMHVLYAEPLEGEQASHKSKVEIC